MPQAFVIPHEWSVLFNIDTNFVSIFDSKNLYEFYLDTDKSKATESGPLHTTVYNYKAEILKLGEKPSKDDAAQVLNCATQIFEVLRDYVPALVDGAPIDFYVVTEIWNSRCPVPDERNPATSKLFIEAIQDALGSLDTGKSKTFRYIFVGTPESLGISHIVLQLWRKDSPIKPKTILQYDVSDIGDVTLSLLIDEAPRLIVDRAFFYEDSKTLPNFSNLSFGVHAHLNNKFGRSFPVQALLSLSDLYSNVGAGPIREAANEFADFRVIDDFAHDFNSHDVKFRERYKIDPISGNSTFSLICDPPKLLFSDYIRDSKISINDLALATEDYLVETSENFIQKNLPDGFSAVDSVLGSGKVCMYPGFRDRIASRLGLRNLAESQKRVPSWMLSKSNFYQLIFSEWDRVLSVLQFHYVSLDLFFGEQDIELVSIQLNVLSLRISDPTLISLFRDSDLHQELRFLLFAKYKVLFRFKLID
jgi:hypothetical protein